MIKRLFGKRPVAGAFATLFLLVAAIFLVITVIPIPRASSYPADAKSDSALLDGYRHVEVASVSDAIVASHASDLPCKVRGICGYCEVEERRKPRSRRPARDVGRDRSRRPKFSLRDGR